MEPEIFYTEFLKKSILFWASVYILQFLIFV
jgi:hypothetical protein